MITATLSKKAQAEEQRQEAINRLRALLPPGATVYCVLRHVSRSGMSRRIDFYTEGGPNGPTWLSGLIATACRMRRNDREGSIVVGGCGMDMGFHLVYELGARLWPAGVPCTGKIHRDGGYALRQAWL